MTGFWISGAAVRIIPLSFGRLHTGIDSRQTDGQITLLLAQQRKLIDDTVSFIGGCITGVDSSANMISASRTAAESLPNYTVGGKSKINFQVHDCSTGLPDSLLDYIPSPKGQRERYTKIFSNAALHWILNPCNSSDFFKDANRLLENNGYLVFEMGGRGNVGEVRAALVMATAKHIGFPAARAADPWFFPSDDWMRGALEKARFEVERTEVVQRSSRLEEGAGLEGWVRLMGKAFLAGVGKGEGEEVVRDVCEALKQVVRDVEGGEEWLQYVRLRVKAKKVGDV